MFHLCTYLHKLDQVCLLFIDGVLVVLLMFHQTIQRGTKGAVTSKHLWNLIELGEEGEGGGGLQSMHLHSQYRDSVKHTQTNTLHVHAT